MMAQFIMYDYMGAPMYEWNIEEFCGYKPKTTYYTDFGIAERFGKDAIVDTYKRAVKYWGDSIEWMTEIVMVLNWKIWEHYHRGNDEMVKFYDELWRKAQDEVFKRYEDDEEAMDYYFRTTD